MKRNQNIENAGNNVRIGFGDDILVNIEDSVLFDKIGDILKAQFDLEDVQNDPALEKMKDTVAFMVTDYSKSKAENCANESFIRQNLCNNDESKLADEIKSIQLEINDNKLNELTAEWVKEWHENKQKSGANDPKNVEIRNFITEAINSTIPEEKTLQIPSVNTGKKKMLIRYSTASAAAILTIFLFIKALVPAAGPEKLFDNYYKPFNVISSVTRSINNSTNVLSSATETYKTGNYEKAASELGSIVEKDPSSPAIFLLGLSEIALKNYDQAINLLEEAVKGNGEYRKEATWYLGLAYLRQGNKVKSAECFKVLSSSDGYYRDRSAEILRRLK